MCQEFGIQLYKFIHEKDEVPDLTDTAVNISTYKHIVHCQVEISSWNRSENKEYMAIIGLSSSELGGHGRPP